MFFSLVEMNNRYVDWFLLLFRIITLPQVLESMTLLEGLMMEPPPLNWMERGWKTGTNPEERTGWKNQTSDGLRETEYNVGETHRVGNLGKSEMARQNRVSPF